MTRTSVAFGECIQISHPNIALDLFGVLTPRVREFAGAASNAPNKLGPRSYFEQFRAPHRYHEYKCTAIATIDIGHRYRDIDQQCSLLEPILRPVFAQDKNLSFVGRILILEESVICPQ